MLQRKVEIITTASGDRIIPPSPEESRAIREQIAADPEDFELDESWFKNAKPTSELFPEAYEAAVQRKADLQSGQLQRIQITLDKETIDWFRTQTGETSEKGGTAWLVMVEQAVKFHVSVATAIGDPHFAAESQSLHELCILLGDGDTIQSPFSRLTGQ